MAESKSITHFKQQFVLLDIEGTTTSISFVKDVLFPYVREHLYQYVTENWSNPELQGVLQLLKEQCQEDISKNVKDLVLITEGEGEKESVIRNVLWQMDLDRKTNALKKLQGHIWKDGYHKGELKGHVYDDVIPVLKLWIQEKRKLYIYSSGSVEAQKLLFGNSIFGDMLELFSGHFDTEVGAKIESKSYVNIANLLQCDPKDILFLTDVLKEAEAATKVGCQVIIVERPGNYPIPLAEKSNFICVQSFNQLTAIK